MVFWVFTFKMLTIDLNPLFLFSLPLAEYLYATLANVVITLTSMFGIVLLLCTACTSVFQSCIQFCISLAVGSLTGDALLHLLPMVRDTCKAVTWKYFWHYVPGLNNYGDYHAAYILTLTSSCGLCVQFLGLHVHSDSSSSQKHSHDGHQEETLDYIYKMLVVIGGIYYFYLMETIFSLIAYKNNHHHHQHHHGVRFLSHSFLYFVLLLCFLSSFYYYYYYC